jgi:SAM-dependent methyltransferase
MARPESTPAQRLKAEAAPIYVAGSLPGETWAHFPSGAIVKAVRSRARSYPGLVSEAPPTGAFYGAALQLPSEITRVIDAGCGSGSGTRRLTQRFDSVTAIERDGPALAFAREHAPLAHFVQADLCRRLDVPAAEAAILADVLGHVKDPAAALRNVAARLVADAPVLIAEPCAHAAQHLVAPSRRAFGRRALRSLLLRSGLEVDAWLLETGSFVSCVARCSADPAIQSLVQAARAGAADVAACRAAYDRAAQSTRDDARLEAALGIAELELARGDGDAAVKALFHARELDLADPRPLVGLSQISLVTGSPHDALKLALDAVRLDPADANATAAVARAAGQLNHPDAFTAWRLAAGLAPDDAAIAIELARSAAERGDYAFGLSVLTRLRQYADALSPTLHVTIAWLLIAEGHLADAVIEARTATALDASEPGLAPLWQALGEAGAPVGRG